MKRLICIYLNIYIIFMILFRYQPTQVDVAVYEAFSNPPSSVTPHVLRWYNHIKSYTNEEKKKFTGIKKLPATLGSSVAPAAAKPPPADDDDDIDLFGSDEEEVSFFYLGFY